MVAGEGEGSLGRLVNARQNYSSATRTMIGTLGDDVSSRDDVLLGSGATRT